MKLVLRQGSVRRLCSAAMFSVALAFGMVACLPTDPELAHKCPGALYCASPIVPQNVAGGTCCVNGTNPSSSSGYLAAFGSDRQPNGCWNTVAEARFYNPSAPGIVLCTAE
jgi:hypothetical protein